MVKRRIGVTDGGKSDNDRKVYTGKAADQFNRLLSLSPEAIARIERYEKIERDTRARLPTIFMD